MHVAVAASAPLKMLVLLLALPFLLLSLLVLLKQKCTYIAVGFESRDFR
jgi:hypothetical protein